jgi:hypothetical protein
VLRSDPGDAPDQARSTEPGADRRARASWCRRTHREPSGCPRRCVPARARTQVSPSSRVQSRSSSQCTSAGSASASHGPLGCKQRRGAAAFARRARLVLLVRTSSAAVGTAPSGRLLSCDRRRRPDACYATKGLVDSAAAGVIAMATRQSPARRPADERSPMNAILAVDVRRCASGRHAGSTQAIGRLLFRPALWQSSPSVPVLSRRSGLGASSPRFRSVCEIRECGVLRVINLATAVLDDVPSIKAVLGSHSAQVPLGLYSSRDEVETATVIRPTFYMHTILRRLSVGFSAGGSRSAHLDVSSQARRPCLPSAHHDWRSGRLRDSRPWLPSASVGRAGSAVIRPSVYTGIDVSGNPGRWQSFVRNCWQRERA